MNPLLDRESAEKHVESALATEQVGHEVGRGVRLANVTSSR